MCIRDRPDTIDFAPPGPVVARDVDWRRYFRDPEQANLVPYQHFELYLLGAAAVCWRILGVSWTALYPLFAILYGATVAVGYGLFRLGMRRIFAVLCAFMLAIAPLHLQQVPHYRDYSKAPFMLAAILVMGLLAKRTFTWRGHLALGALGGAAIGIGVGFRPDVSICLPPFIIVTLLFLPGGLLRAWKSKLLVLAAFFATYYLSAWPILRALSAGSNVAHAALLGLLAFCDARLGLAAPLYDFGNPYLDYYVRTAVQSYAQRIHGHDGTLLISSPLYETYCWRYYLDIATRFPADLALRAYASVLRVLDEMRVSVDRPAPRGITNAVVVAMYKARVVFLNGLIGSGRYYTGLALAMIGAANLRLGFCVFFLLLYFAGYPAIQFNLRHCFHLEFISLWVLGFLAQQALDAIRTTLKHTAKPWDNATLRRATAFIAPAVLLIVLPVFSLRVYQRHTANAFLHACIEAPRERIPWEAAVVDDEHALVTAPHFSPAHQKTDTAVETDYFMARFELLPGETMPLTLRYEADDPEYDFTRDDLVLHGPGGCVFFPVYRLSPATCDGVTQHFAGIELSADAPPPIEGLYRVTDLSNLPLLLYLRLPDDWQEQPSHQVFTR